MTKAHSSSKPSRVLLVDDHPILHTGVRNQMAPHKDLEICAAARSAREALEAAEKHSPDLALVDLSLPDSHGLQLIKQLRTNHPAMRILVFSMHDERVYGERSLRAGADGFLMKDAPPERVVEAMHTVLSGEIAVSATLSARMLKAAAGRRPRQGTAAGVDLLSDRELEVYSAIGRGESTKEIAHRFDRSVKTVETHRLRIKQKLDLRSNGELIASAACWVNELK